MDTYDTWPYKAIIRPHFALNLVTLSPRGEPMWSAEQCQVSQRSTKLLRLQCLGEYSTTLSVYVFLDCTGIDYTVKPYPSVCLFIMHHKSSSLIEGTIVRLILGGAQPPFCATFCADAELFACAALAKLREVPSLIVLSLFFWD